MPPRSTRLLTVSLLALGTVVASGFAIGQSPPAPRAGPPFTIVTTTGRQPLPTTIVGGQEFVSLDDLAQRFGLSVREDAMAGGITVTGGAGPLVLSLNQGLASAGGRLVSLPAPPLKVGRSWLVPIELVGRGLPLVHTSRVELRRTSRLLLVGAVRVPRLTIRREARPDGVRVTIDMAPRADHSVEQQPGRVLVRFDADALDADLPASDRPDLLSALRIAEPGNVLALELGPRFGTFRATDAPGEAGAARLTIDVLPAGVSTSATPSTPQPPTPEPPPITFEQPRSAIRTIVLDPGHGGEENGAAGPSGALEKDVALTVARQLKASIEARLGIRVILTRDGDQTVALDARAAIANNNKADLFLSLHANASVRDTVAGAEVFYLSLDEYDPETRRLAQPVSERIPSLGGDREVHLILWEMAQARHLDASARLAALVESELRSRVPMSPRAIQQAPFRVLVGANMPAVLVEMGFMTNPDEEKKLTSTAHQALVTQALYDSIVKFRGWLEGAEPRPAATGGGTR